MVKTLAMLTPHGSQLQEPELFGTAEDLIAHDLGSGHVKCIERFNASQHIDPMQSLRYYMWLSRIYD